MRNMANTASGRHIQLHDFTVRSLLPLPKLLRHPSRLTLKFSVNGINEKVLSLHEDTEVGTWKAGGNVQICDDQLLTATILVCVKDSTKELNFMTVSYSKLLAHAEARSRECHEFIVDMLSSPVIILVTCYIRTVVSPAGKQVSFTEHAFSLRKSKSDKVRSGSNQALILDVSSTLSIADLERDYIEASSLPAEHKSGVLNAIGCDYFSVYIMTNELGHLNMAMSMFGEALQNANLDPKQPEYLNNLAICYLRRFEHTGSHDDIEDAVSKSQVAVQIAEMGDSNRHQYILHYSNALLNRFKCLGKLGDLQKSISFMKMAVGLLLDGHPDKPGFLSNLGSDFVTRFRQLGHVEDLETAIIHQQKAVNLTPDGHPDKPGYLNNLGNAFGTRFLRLGHVKDLEASIVYTQKAVGLSPDDHPKKRNYLDGLGNAFIIRFDRLGRIEDLETGFVYKQKTVDLTPDGHPEKPLYLDNLGSVLVRRFEWLGRIEDLETAIAHKQKAVDLMPNGHPDKPICLTSLGSILEQRFRQLGHIKDVETAISYEQDAVDLTPDAHPDKANLLIVLGRALMHRFALLWRTEDVHMAIIQCSKAASLPTASPRVRLDAAKSWALASEVLEVLGVSKSFPLEPYQIAVDLLPRVAWLGIPMSTQHTLLEDVGGIVREAVSAAIKVEEYETAVEWAEAGRSIAWQNLLHLRTPVNELRSAHYDLADRLETISRQLDMSVRGSDDGMKGTTEGMEDISRSHVQLALDWDSTVADIRSKPGFESFLKPKSFNQLRCIARNGPVVILNVNRDRCDALVLIPEDNSDNYVSNISLDSFSYAKCEALHKELKGLLSSKHLRARDSRKAMRMPIDAGDRPLLRHILRCLWLDVVKPIIEALSYQPRSTDLPRIWWCATGPLAFLPIHAAGIYDTDELGSKLSDYVVSSYTPALSKRTRNIINTRDRGRSEEIQTLANNIDITTMKKEDATVESVWRGMENSNWVHLACHGQQNIKEPMKSGLLLHDGTLELQRLIEKPLPLADFAFLSACQTASGDESVAEESLHLAAGMLFAGYKGVIATMWSIMDDIGPRVAEDVYREMLKDGKPNRKAAAHALHYAAKRLREDPKVDMLHWIPFIHIGL